MRHMPRLSLLLTLGASLGLSACWLPPAEVIREKTEMRKKWRAQAKLRTELRADIPAEGKRVKDQVGTSGLSVDVPDFGDDKLAYARTPAAKPAATDAAPSFETLGPVKAKKPDKKREAIAPKEPTRQAAQVTPVEGVANLVSLTRPSSPLAVDAPWQDKAPPAALARIDGWRTRFDSDVQAVITRGDGFSVARGGRLFESDAAMLYGLMPPGLYDCQLFTVNAEMQAFTQSETGKCRVAVEGETRQFSFLTTTETVLGQLHDNDAFTSIYLGKGLADVMGAPIANVDAAEVGVVQRIADTRWRIIIPGEGAQGSYVLELTRPRMAQ